MRARGTTTRVGGARDRALGRCRPRPRPGRTARVARRTDEHDTRGGPMSALKRVLVLSLVAGVVAGAAFAASGDYGSWSQAVRVESIPGTDPSFNGASLDGCPFVSRDGKTFYMASNRPGGLGGIDIWVSRRASVDDPWGAPANVGAPVNSEANDFCPTIS